MKRIIALFTVVAMVAAVSCTGVEPEEDGGKSVITPEIVLETEGELIAGVSEVDFNCTTTVEGTEIEKYYWHFGFDGTGNWSDKENPGPVIYPSAGEFEVSLTVTGKDGNKSTATFKVTITADNIPPVADFTYAPEMINLNEPVTFTCASTDLDGQIVTREWTLPDGSKSAEKSFEWTFTKTGLYDITIKVTDDRGKTHSATKAVSASLKIDGLTLAWSTPVTSSIVEANANVVAVSDLGYVYFTSTEGKIVALNSDGEQMWNYDATADGVAFTNGVSYPSVDTDGTVYWAASGDDKVGTTPAYVYAFDGKAGSLKWKLLWGDPSIFETGSTDIEKVAAGDWFSYSTPLILDKHIVVAGRGEKCQITFLDKATGKKNCWVNPKNGRVPSVITALRNKNMFFAGSAANGYETVIPSSSDENTWTNATFTSYSRAASYTKNNELMANNCQLCIDAVGNVYFAGIDVPDQGNNGDYTFACAPFHSYNPIEQNSKTWAVKLAGGFDKNGASISADGKTLYIISDYGEPYNVYAVDAANGNIKWTYPLGTDKCQSVPAVDNLGQIHFCSTEGNYYVLSADGSVVYKQKVADSITGSPTISPVTGASYFVGADANANCLKVYSLLFPNVSGPADSAWAQYGQNARHCQQQK